MYMHIDELQNAILALRVVRSPPGTSIAIAQVVPAF